MTRDFRQVDVFTTAPYLGNPVAVVLGADGMDDEDMRQFANWTNLSETTFVLTPEAEGADYRVRIFTPTSELPFAGYPTLGTCHAWLEAGGVPRSAGIIVQECQAGLIPIRQNETAFSPPRLAFAAPPLVRSGPVEDSDVERVARSLNIDRSDIVDIQWADNGPGWVAVLLASPEAVLALEPGLVEGDIGVAGLYPAGSPEALEVRAFTGQVTTVEDPVTGSLNASLAQWLTSTGRLAAPYVACQGTALGRRGRVTITQDTDGQIWVGGGTVTCITGTVEL
ncbi:MAG TPA: PhzF family phenazine biosynthesis protein [Streptosporangiaceae bacterium]|nr:PhzF family phenazine biosynthesis protein [Streptosporangiaceae bacterium]